MENINVPVWASVESNLAFVPSWVDKTRVTTLISEAGGKVKYLLFSESLVAALESAML